MSDSTGKKVFCNNCKYFIPYNDNFGIGKCVAYETETFDSLNIMNYYYTPRVCDDYKRRMFPVYDVEVPLSEAQIKSITCRKWLRDLEIYNTNTFYVYSDSDGFHPVVTY